MAYGEIEPDPERQIEGVLIPDEIINPGGIVIFTDPSIARDIRGETPDSPTPKEVLSRLTRGSRHGGELRRLLRVGAQAASLSGMSTGEAYDKGAADLLEASQALEDRDTLTALGMVAQIETIGRPTTSLDAIGGPETETEAN